jgi:biopolymer transport protein ExbD
VAVSVTPEAVLIQGEPVMKTALLYDERIGTVREVTDRLAEIQRSMESEAGARTQAEKETREITLLADKTIPFNVLKKVMTSCTASGYGKISLAVIQKAAHG